MKFYSFDEDEAKSIKHLDGLGRGFWEYWTSLHVLAVNGVAKILPEVEARGKARVGGLDNVVLGCVTGLEGSRGIRGSARRRRSGFRSLSCFLVKDSVMIRFDDIDEKSAWGDRNGIE